MTLQQLEYLVGIARDGNFRVASERMHVTQPTLSMQLQNIEQELGGKLLDRSKQPVVPTALGALVIEQAKVILYEVDKLRELAKKESVELQGELRVGIIPTIAPYLVPLFLGEFQKAYPLVVFRMFEYTTDELVKHLKDGNIDCGILSTPLLVPGIVESPLYYESFVTYVHPHSKISEKKEVADEDLLTEQVWLLKEGHCFRNQVFQVCKRNHQENNNTIYESGSIETLKRIVDRQAGVTILPEMALEHMGENDLENIRYFKKPEPLREVSIVVYRHQVKDKLILALTELIKKMLPVKYLRQPEAFTVIKPI